MKFVCDAAGFSERLSTVQGISERRITMPILSHVLVTANVNNITITATDLENTVQTECSAMIQSGGKIALPSKKLYEIIREIHSGDIEITQLDNNWVQIQSAGVSFKIAGLPAADFPSLPVEDGNDSVQVNSSQLEDMISKTFFAVSTDDLRRNLAGLYLEPYNENTLRVIGTDGHRLSFVQSNFGNGVGFTSGIIVPRKGVVELRKILKVSSQEEIKFSVVNNFLIAEAEHIKLFSRLIELEYPDYKQVIPDQSKYSFQVNREALQSAVRRVSVLSSEKTHSIKMNLSDSKLQLLSVTPEIGEAREEIQVDYTDEPVELGFNSLYIQDVLEAIDTDMVTVQITDELSPAILKPAESEDYISVIMPMRV